MHNLTIDLFFFIYEIKSTKKCVSLEGKIHFLSLCVHFISGLKYATFLLYDIKWLFNAEKVDLRYPSISNNKKKWIQCE